MTEPIILSPEEKVILNSWARARSMPMRVVQRAHIIKMSAEGVLSQDIAKDLNVSRPTVDPKN